MIHEYKNELECAGIFIESIRGRYGGYYLIQDIKIPEENKKIINHSIISTRRL